MKILLVILGITLFTSCGGSPATNTNANANVNFTVIGNSNIQNTNLSNSNISNSNISGNLSNISTNNVSTTDSSTSVDPELYRQIENQQKETSDIRKAANAANPEKSKSVSKPPAGSPKTF